VSDRRSQTSQLLFDLPFSRLHFPSLVRSPRVLLPDPASELPDCVIDHIVSQDIGLQFAKEVPFDRVPSYCQIV